MSSEKQLRALYFITFILLFCDVSASGHLAVGAAY
jgi:hypothetical protein